MNTKYANIIYICCSNKLIIKINTMEKVGNHLEMEDISEQFMEGEKIYLTEEEKQSFQVLNTKQQVLAQKQERLVELEVSRVQQKIDCKVLKKEIPNLKKDIELTDQILFNQLTSKYGKFRLGENNEVIKVGE